MSEDLQSLLEKINRDGVEKANAAADKIIADAKAKAAEIVKAATADAAKAKADAEKAAADYTARASETVAQAARDTILKIEASVTAMLTALLAKDVDATLSDEKNVAALALEAVKGLVLHGVAVEEDDGLAVQAAQVQRLLTGEAVGFRHAEEEPVGREDKV